MKEWLERRRTQTEDRGGFRCVSLDSHYQRDRARVIHSSAFRRLQSKTQVLGVGESDFYRTRLTHSLEVAQIGSGICEFLREKYRDFSGYQTWIPSMSLIESLGLSHDIGHPPFGHGGEVALNYFMAEHGGFESNGQTLRIASKLGEYSPKEGLDFTRRTLLGILKYPCLHRAVAGYQLPAGESTDIPLNIEPWRPPKCIMDDDEDILDWILLPFSPQDRGRLTEFCANPNSHGMPLHHSFDCSIMELADDIAYGVHDLEDALALQLVSFKQWQDHVVSRVSRFSDGELKQNMAFYSEKLFSESNQDRKHAISRLVGHFIAGIRIVEDNRFDHPLLRYNAMMESPAKESLELLKGFVFRQVIQGPEVQALEYKGQRIILRIFEVLYENAKRLLPEQTFQKMQTSSNPKREVSDFVSGMTNHHATRLYHRLFSPSMGSVFDKV